LIRLGLALLGTVLRASLFAIIDAEAVECAADDVVANTGEVTDSPAADEDDGVFLKVVPFATDVCSDFFAIGEADTSDLPECGVRLLGCRCLDGEAHASPLRTALHITRI